MSQSKELSRRETEVRRNVATAATNSDVNASAEDNVLIPRPENMDSDPRMTSTSASVSGTQALADDVSSAMKRSIGEAFENHRRRKNELRLTAMNLADDVAYISEAIKRLEGLVVGSPWESVFAQDKAAIAAAEDFLAHHLEPYLLVDAEPVDTSSDEAEQGEEECREMLGDI